MFKIFYKVSLLFLLIGLFGPVYLHADEKRLPNAGFVSQNIWYSEQEFFAGDNVFVHAVIKSDGEYDFLGTVRFYDNEELLGSTDFNIKKGLYVGDTKIEWVATNGEHNISAKILNSRIVVKGEEIPILVSDSESASSKSFVDLDTDGDGIGNKEDLDDDGDGLSDIEELKLGTNPLVKDVKKIETDGVAPHTGSSHDDVFVSNTIEIASNAAKGNIIPVAKSVAQKVFKATEIARNTQQKFANEKIVKVKEAILDNDKNKDKAKEKGFDARTPFNYTSLLALTFLSYTSKYSFLYYGLIGLAVLYFMIILWRRWRR
jgi:hypothetical protein